MLGDKIKELRDENKITQSNLAQSLGVSPSTVGMWEQNRRTPDTELLKKISDLFKVSIDYLLEKTNIRNYESKETTVALHTDDYDELPQEAKDEINNFIEYVKQKYKK